MTIQEAVRSVVAELHNDNFGDVDKQCHERFGMSWDEVRTTLQQRLLGGLEILPGLSVEDEVRTTLQQRLLGGLEILPGLSVEPEYVLEGVGSFGGNWMVNRYLRVLFLSINPSELTAEYALRQVGEEIPDDVYCDFSMGGYRGTLLWHLLRLGRKYAPELVRDVLDSHGLTEKEGYHVRGVAITVENGRVEVSELVVP